MTWTRRTFSTLLFGLGFAFLIAALIALLAGDAHAQTKKPKPEEEQVETQSVHYPDICSVTEEGSWTWYLLLCPIR